MLVHLGSAARCFRLASHFRPSTPSSTMSDPYLPLIISIRLSLRIQYHLQRIKIHTDGCLEYFSCRLSVPFLLSCPDSNSRYFSFVLIKPSRSPYP